MPKTNLVRIRPMNVTLRQRSKAEKVFRAKAAMPKKSAGSARVMITPNLVEFVFARSWRGGIRRHQLPSAYDQH